MIYQTHTDHGKHMSLSPQEAKTNEENGWTTVSKETFYNIEPIKNNEEKDNLIKAYTEKFGKKPHHKMTEKTIQERLNG